MTTPHLNARGPASPRMRSRAQHCGMNDPTVEGEGLPDRPGTDEMPLDAEPQPGSLAARGLADAAELAEDAAGRGPTGGSRPLEQLGARRRPPVGPEQLGGPEDLGGDQARAVGDDDAALAGQGPKAPSSSAAACRAGSRS